MSETSADPDCDCTVTVAGDDAVRVELPVRTLLESVARQTGADGGCCPGCPCC